MGLKKVRGVNDREQTNALVKKRGRGFCVNPKNNYCAKLTLALQGDIMEAFSDGDLTTATRVYNRAITLPFDVMKSLPGRILVYLAFMLTNNGGKIHGSIVLCRARAKLISEGKSKMRVDNIIKDANFKGLVNYGLNLLKRDKLVSARTVLRLAHRACISRSRPIHELCSYLSQKKLLDELIDELTFYLKMVNYKPCIWMIPFLLEVHLLNNDFVRFKKTADMAKEKLNKITSRTIQEQQLLTRINTYCKFANGNGKKLPEYK